MIFRTEPQKKVSCPDGNFVSNRYLLESDQMGFTVTRTEIPKGTRAVWHYKKHMEACYCISGIGIVRTEQRSFTVVKDCMYALDKNDRHEFEALTDVVLLCVFNPPLKGDEIHKEDGSYE